MFRGVLAAAAVGGALAVAAPAGAVTLLSASMDTSYTAVISGPLVNVDAYIGPVTFTTDLDPITAYCVDIFHDMSLGPLNGGAGYAYHEESLTTDNSASTPSGQAGVSLTGPELQDISALLNFSLTLNPADSDFGAKRAGIQGAIWEIENPLYTVTPAQASVTTYMNLFYAAAPHLQPGSFHTIFANDYGHQAFAYGGGVPEPATWTMLIMGFGALGAMARRRRAVLVKA
jgi:hypothetical protein